MPAFHSPETDKCENPVLRMEWRTLDTSEKATYIRAVQCLMNYPSANHAQTSFYDDMVLAHARTGSFSHYTAPFLPWHRLFIHVYERALREKCGYAGTFP